MVRSYEEETFPEDYWEDWYSLETGTSYSHYSEDYDLTKKQKKRLKKREPIGFHRLGDDIDQGN